MSETHAAAMRAIADGIFANENAALVAASLMLKSDRMN